MCRTIGFGEFGVLTKQTKSLCLVLFIYSTLKAVEMY